MTTSRNKTENGNPAFESAISVGNKAAESFVKASAEAMKGFDSVTGFSKETIEAVVRSNSILAKGWETIGNHWMELAKDQFEDSVAASKALMGCKSVKDVLDVQGALARKSFDKVVSQSAAISEVSAKVAGEALAPITSRVTATFEKFAKPYVA